MPNMSQRDADISDDDGSDDEYIVDPDLEYAFSLDGLTKGMKRRKCYLQRFLFRGEIQEIR